MARGRYTPPRISHRKGAITDTSVEPPRKKFFAESIFAGTLDASLIKAGTIDAAFIKKGTVGAVRIPNISANKITSGTFIGGDFIVGSPGIIKSSNYSLGTAGFRLHPSDGLRIYSGGIKSSLLIGNVAQIFTENGTFTVPAGVTKIFVTLVGAGGGGGGGTGDPTQLRGGGGGGGAAVVDYYVPVTPGTQYTITVGVGGAGGVGQDGVDGGDTSFGSVVSVEGGNAGVCANPSGAGGTGGTGITEASGITAGSIRKFAGGNGAAGGGDGGGGGGGSILGAGGTGGTPNGAAGNGIGSGGGGCNSGSGTQTGGNGANGICIIKF